MAVFLNNLQTSYNISGAQIPVFPVPIVQNRAPGVNDNAIVGTIWINSVTNFAYICTEDVPNASVWREISEGGGGDFASITTTTGPNSLVTTVNQANAQQMVSNGGTAVTMDFLNLSGTGAASMNFESDLGGVNIEAGLSAANALVLHASGAAGQTVIRSGTGGIVIGPDNDTTFVDINNIVPIVNRDTIIAGGTLASAVADSVSIAGDGVNFLGSIKLVEIATGNVVAGTNRVDIATGTGTSDINIGSTTTDTVDLKGIVNINDSINAAAAINGGTSNGTISIGNAAAGAVTVDTAAGISLDAATASNFTSSIAATAEAIVIEASAVNSGVAIKAGSAGIAIGNEGDTAVIGIGNVVPTANRTVTIASGTMVTGAPIADVLTMANGDLPASAATDQLSRTVNLGVGVVSATTNAAATSDLAVNIATGVLSDDTTGTATLTVNIGTGASTDAAHVTNISTGAHVGTSAKTVNIGSTTTVVNVTGNDVTVTTPATTVAGTGLGVICGAGAEIKILAGAGNPANGVQLAPKGSLYINTAAVLVGDRLWIASAADTWVFFTASA